MFVVLSTCISIAFLACFIYNLKIYRFFSFEQVFEIHSLSYNNLQHSQCIIKQNRNNKKKLKLFFQFLNLNDAGYSLSSFYVACKLFGDENKIFVLCVGVCCGFLSFSSLTIYRTCIIHCTQLCILH